MSSVTLRRSLIGILGRENVSLRVSNEKRS